MKATEEQLRKAEDCLLAEGNNALSLERQIKAVEDELLKKQKDLLKLVEEEADDRDVIESYFERVSGLGVRCLNKHLLSVVFGYLPRSHSAGCVSKYWYQIASDTRVLVVSGAEKNYYASDEIRQLKLSGKLAGQTDGSSDGTSGKENGTIQAAGERPLPAPRFQLETHDAQVRRALRLRAQGGNKRDKQPNQASLLPNMDRYSY
jgi:hypothetical protein